MQLTMSDILRGLDYGRSEIQSTVVYGRSEIQSRLIYGRSDIPSRLSEVLELSLCLLEKFVSDSEISDIF